VDCQISVNVRYKLWRMGEAREQWAAWLQARTQLGLRFLRDLLSGRIVDGQLSPYTGELSRAFDIDEETLLFADLVRDGGVNVLQTNLQFLFETLEHGGKKVLAESLELDPTTISRWLKGSYAPHGPTLQQLVSYFGLPAATDLRSEPVFLSIEPIAISQRRAWLHRRVEALAPDELRELYPALKRLLEEQ
jgi:transcriptional regulator with XRE-family HTH domain